MPTHYWPAIFVQIQLGFFFIVALVVGTIKSDSIPPTLRWTITILLVIVTLAIIAAWLWNLRRQHVISTEETTIITKLIYLEEGLIANSTPRYISNPIKCKQKELINLFKRLLIS